MVQIACDFVPGAFGGVFDAEGMAYEFEGNVFGEFERMDDEAI